MPEYTNYTIIPYSEKYRDDMIFMVLEAKDALGRIPKQNEDLLDVKKHYLDIGDMFWLAIDEHDRVTGCIGYCASVDRNTLNPTVFIPSTDTLFMETA